jgi:hypothetical protein
MHYLLTFLCHYRHHSFSFFYHPKTFLHFLPFLPFIIAPFFNHCPPADPQPTLTAPVPDSRLSVNSRGHLENKSHSDPSAVGRDHIQNVL